MQLFVSFPYICSPLADVAKLADALDLGSSAARHVGSTPIIRTQLKKLHSLWGFFLFLNNTHLFNKEINYLWQQLPEKILDY